VETEPLGIEVAIGLTLIATDNLKFARLDQTVAYCVVPGSSTFSGGPIVAS
jgi:hypothetical protein